MMTNEYHWDRGYIIILQKSQTGDIQTRQDKDMAGETTQKKKHLVYNSIGHSKISK